MVGSARQWVQKQKDLFLKVSREKRGTVSREVSRERIVLDSMDAKGQKYIVACCSDRYTENRDEQFCFES